MRFPLCMRHQIKGKLILSKVRVAFYFSVVDGACAPLMNRGPPSITIIERSVNTTVNQGPMQLHVSPRADETNSLVSLFKGEVLISI